MKKINKLKIKFKSNEILKGIGDCGLGIVDRVLGFGDWG